MCKMEEVHFISHLKMSIFSKHMFNKNKNYFTMNKKKKIFGITAVQNGTFFFKELSFNSKQPKMHGI